MEENTPMKTPALLVLAALMAGCTTYVDIIGQYR
jgi:hypothetical protein